MHARARALFVSGLRVVLVAVGLLAVGVTTTTAAYAHDSLIDSTPSDGQAVPEAPSEIELVYSGNIGTDPEFTQVSVLSPDGQDHADGAPVIEGDTLTQAVTELSAGDYEIGYRVVSSDGHPIEDTLTFSVESDSPESGAQAGASEDDQADSGTQTAEPTDEATEQAQPTEPGPATTETSAPVASDTGEQGGSTMWIVAALVAVVVVGIATMLIRRGRVPDDTA